MTTILKETPLYRALINENLGEVQGNWKFWKGFAATNGSGECWTFTQYWKQNKDGTESKMQESAPTVAKKKNVGKANETSWKDQAISELQTQVNKKIDDGYYIEGQERPVKFPLPMLAHVFKDHESKVTYPCVAQPKFDGQRMLTNGVDCWSRKGKTIIPECVRHILFDTEGYIVDGELIMPEEYTFNESMKAIKKFDPATSPLLIYRVYDIVNNELPFRERYEILQGLVAKDPNPNVLLADTILVYDKQALLDYHSGNVENGFEGTMIRRDGIGYEINKRSSQLLKLKDWFVEDFIVEGVEDGEGKCKGQAMFICRTTEGHEFTVTPKLTANERKRLYANPDEVIGTKWSVKYTEYTKTAKPVPRNASALGERND